MSSQAALNNFRKITKGVNRNVPTCLNSLRNFYFVERKYTLIDPKKLSIKFLNIEKLHKAQYEFVSTFHDNHYEKICVETLESLTEFFENICEKHSEFTNADVTFNDGVLTVNLGNEYGTYVINRQSPNKQIWLSSPRSGPKRYDYDQEEKCWIYKHDGQTLHSLLQMEIGSLLGEEIDLSQCAYSKSK